MVDKPSHPVDRPLTPEQHWGSRAACRHLDPDLFFPIHTADIRAAKRFCGHCQVRRDCLDAVLRKPQKLDPGGIVGGLTERQRRQARAALERAEGNRPQGSPRERPRRAISGKANRVPRARASIVFTDRDKAVVAFRLAERLTIAGAARRFRVTPRTLRAAWERWDLGTPDTAAAIAEVRRRVRPSHYEPPARQSRQPYRPERPAREQGR